MFTASSLNLTFGVELEFIIKYHPDFLTSERLKGGLDHNVDRRSSAIHTQISQALQAADVPVTLQDMGDAANWSILLDRSIEFTEERLWDLEYRFIGIEVRSRILPGQTPEQLGESLDEVRLVIDTIAQLPFTLLTNRTTGLHVHVGNRHQGFPLRTLRNLCQTVHGLSRSIESIHPSHRVSSQHAASYCSPPSRAFPSTNGPTANLLLVEECATRDALIDLLNPGAYKSHAYNLANLDTRRGPPSTLKQTVEFRQHAGSVDAEEVCAWVEAVTGLVQWCHHVPSGVLIPLLMDAEQQPGFGLLEVLKVLGKEHLCGFYRGRIGGGGSEEGYGEGGEDSY
ncbi:MAG: hypothetical protein Q9187_002999 [Circinaria calcarea]